MVCTSPVIKVLIGTVAFTRGAPSIGTVLSHSSSALFIRIAHRGCTPQTNDLTVVASVQVYRCIGCLALSLALASALLALRFVALAPLPWLRSDGLCAGSAPLAPLHCTRSLQFASTVARGDWLRGRLHWLSCIGFAPLIALRCFSVFLAKQAALCADMKDRCEFIFESNRMFAHARIYFCNQSRNYSTGASADYRTRCTLAVYVF